ncbi:MAG: polyphosphate kinase 2 family protein, partial [Dehalococcoidia bacterium]
MRLAIQTQPKKRVNLSTIDPDFTAGLDRVEALERLDRLGEELVELQELLYGAASHSVLVILQGMDSSGKDGVVRHVFTRINPLGCRVISFKAPTPAELGHDFLWRVHKVTPEKGQIHVFNRSHYEDVLVARVHDLVPSGVWFQRYTQINHFEALLAENVAIIVKFLLCISKSA